MSEEQIYRTVLSLSQGQAPSSIPTTILKELESNGYIKILYTETDDENQVLLQDKGQLIIDKSRS